MHRYPKGCTLVSEEMEVAGWRLEAPVEGFEGWDKDTGPDASSAPHTPTHTPHTNTTQTCTQRRIFYA
jgi:hypothetical protein